MSKVKLVTVQGTGSDGRPYIGGSEKVVDINLEVPETHTIMGIIRTDFDEDADGVKRVSDELTPVIPYEHINNLVGKLLTLVDATFHDPEQRKAVKDLIINIPWDWYNSKREALVSPWRKDKGVSVQ